MTLGRCSLSIFCSRGTPPSHTRINVFWKCCLEVYCVWFMVSQGDKGLSPCLPACLPACLPSSRGRATQLPRRPSCGPRPSFETRFGVRHTHMDVIRCQTHSTGRASVPDTQIGTRLGVRHTRPRDQGERIDALAVHRVDHVLVSGRNSV